LIFVTVGSQTPFDRLIRGIDEWAKMRTRQDVFAQIGDGNYRPAHIRSTAFVDPAEFARLVREAQLIVAHAGMGSIISALEFGKPIVVMPRRAKFNETRNDHQVASAHHFGAHGRVLVAQDEHELAGTLDRAVALRNTDPLDPQASRILIATIRAFLDRHAYRLYPEVSIERITSYSSDPLYTTASALASDKQV